MGETASVIATTVTYAGAWYIPVLSTIFGGAAVAGTAAILRVRSQNRLDRARAKTEEDDAEARPAEVLMKLAQGAAVVQSGVLQEANAALVRQGGEIRDLQAEVAKLREVLPTVEKCQREIEALRGQLTEVTRQRDVAKREAKEAKAEAEKLRERVTRLERQLDELKSR